MTKFEEKLALIIRERHGYLPSINTEEALHNLANELLATLNTICVEKIRAKIERLSEEIDKVFPNDHNLGRYDVCQNLLTFINSMQEEQESPCNTCEGDKLAGTCASITELGRCPLKYRKENATSEIDFEKEYKEFVENDSVYNKLVNNIAGKSIAKHFYDMGYFDGHIHDGDKIAHVDGRRVNVSRFRRLAKPVKETVSEDLEEAIGQSFIYHENRGDDFRSDKQIETAYRYGFETGANWQKEQMMKEAVDGRLVDDGGDMILVVPSLPIITRAMDDGDKVKVILVK